MNCRTERRRATLWFLVAAAAVSCTKPIRQPVTLTLIDQDWVEQRYQDWRGQEYLRFTQQTGIRVQTLPEPESAIEQLALWRKLLDNKSPTPDVYAIDAIWPAILAPHLIDLKRSFTPGEIAAFFPGAIANDTVNDKLVGVPYATGSGLLYYHADLLARYGYVSPPATWDELEAMAARIQAGERAKGKKGFWGFVWQGASSEALTCNALEWQVSEGGGLIVESDGRISVNNPRAIAAWQRAARWVGSISPPGVIAYREWDAFNLWQSGDVAFMRNWPTANVAGHSEPSGVARSFDLTVLPAGSAGRAAVLGGASYGVSQYSEHPAEAAALVRFLSSREAQLRRSRIPAEPPSMPDVYNDPEVAKANPYLAAFKRAYLKGEMAFRPSAVTGLRYPEVSRAYSDAVHTVLTGQQSAARAAASLETELQRILDAPASSAAHGRTSEGRR